MAITTKVQKIRLYDDATTGRSITYSTQRVGDGEDIGLSSALNTKAIAPGTLADGVYTRTDLTNEPEEVRNIANTCWTEAVYTAHEAKLRG